MMFGIEGSRFLRRVVLAVQEIEFAFACKTFVLEMDPRAGDEIISKGDALTVRRSAAVAAMVLRTGSRNGPCSLVRECLRRAHA